MRLTVTVKPNARERKIQKLPDGSLIAYVTSPPVEGRANEELVEFLAELYGVPKSAVTIHRGHAGRTKIIDIDKKALAMAKPPEAHRAAEPAVASSAAEQKAASPQGKGPKTEATTVKAEPEGPVEKPVEEVAAGAGRGRRTRKKEAGEQAPAAKKTASKGKTTAKRKKSS